MQGGCRQQNLGVYVLPRFSKIGSPELNFWLKNRGLWNKISLKFVSRELKIKSKSAKIGLEMQDFFLKKMEVGSLELEKGLKR